MTLTAADIDARICRIYDGNTGGGELKQLSLLFSRAFWKDFEDLLNRKFTRRSGPFRQEVSVGLGYIDKIPVAEFDPPALDVHGNAITQQTELGDAAFFFVDKTYRPDGTWHTSFARGLILQAKQATTDTLPKNVPIVPLPTTPNDSTLKELALLSTWPPFNLSFTANSATYLQKGYSIASASHAIQPHGWYIGASPKTRNPWSPHWIAGPSSNGAKCDATLGQLLYAVLADRGRINGSDAVGMDFDYDPSRLVTADFSLASTGTPPNWSDLCHQVMLACNKYEWPSHLFPKSKQARSAGTTLYSTPFDQTFATVWDFLKRLIPTGMDADEGRRFPVVVVERASSEFERAWAGRR